VSFTDLVRPKDPVVARLLGRLPAGADGAAALRVLVAETIGWSVSLRPGPAADFEAMARAAEMNCIDFAVLSCSALRAVGLVDAYVVMGSLVGTFPLTAHAWTAFRDDGPAGAAVGGLVVDVRNRSPRPVPPGWSASIDPVAAFNDAHAALGRGSAMALIDNLERKVAPA
jgi:transglutaminase-like putative cysteine protease